jgi:hypothetical protein
MERGAQPHEPAAHDHRPPRHSGGSVAPEMVESGPWA